MADVGDHKESPYSLASHLCNVLSLLSSSPFPSIAAPQNLKKRASVALVIRISPSHSEWPATSSKLIIDLQDFFTQSWVQHGHPEVLFIKRAARKGDRWTSHIALPGGKRDPEDADDLAAAIRETWEEVGLDVSQINPYVLQTGNLPQRVITTNWGKQPLMVLCPYIFLITRHGVPPLKLQPTEVASCHWVPLAELLDARNRTTRQEDVTNRLANQEVGLRRWVAGVMIGKMIFSAVQLKPSESVKCTASPAVKQAGSDNSIPTQMLQRLGLQTGYETEPPLLLWGLTLGVMADFLDLLPPHNAFSLWSYPTFTPWDIRFVIWAMSFRFKRRKASQVQQIRDFRATTEAVEVGLESVSMPSEDKLREAGISGLSTGFAATNNGLTLKSSAVSTMLEGYYDIVRRAMILALVGRTAMATTVASWIIWKIRKRAVANA